MLCFLVLPSHSTNSLVDSPSSFRIELNDLKKEDIEVNRDTEAENTHLPTSSRTNVITLPHIQSSPLYSRLTYSLSVSIHLTKPPTLCHVMSCHSIPFYPTPSFRNPLSLRAFLTFASFEFATASKSARTNSGSPTICAAQHREDK